MPRKPILCVDFDGVIHSYTSRWIDAATIPDPPVEGAMAFLVEAAKTFEVNVYSSRSSQPGGIVAMKQYLAHHLVGHVPESIYSASQATGGEPTLRAIYFATEIVKWPTVKPAAFLTIDDRAIQFNGVFPADPAALIRFKPWNKRGAEPRVPLDAPPKMAEAPEPFDESALLGPAHVQREK